MTPTLVLNSIAAESQRRASSNEAFRKLAIFIGILV